MWLGLRNRKASTTVGEQPKTSGGVRYLDGVQM